MTSDPERRGSAWEVFVVFGRLGLTSFGGPVAHLGYFREAFVRRRRWLDDAHFTDVVTLCHLLPGPASSQVGMVIGLHRAGLRGLLAAWLAFTAPSAALMILFAYGTAVLGDSPGVLAGLMAVAVAVVAHAVIAMARAGLTSIRAVTVAVLACAVVLLVPGVIAQVGVIGGSAVLGRWWLPAARGQRLPVQDSVTSVSTRLAWVSAGLFGALLVVLPLLARLTNSGTVTLLDVFYRTGALVFGGGHVVLPLLEAELLGPGLIDADTFLAGYGAAQALPGPLFAFAAHVGFVWHGAPHATVGALIAVFAIFLPSVLLILGVMPLWQRLRHAVTARRMLSGINAGVVGLLAAALIDPVATTGVVSPVTAVIAVTGFAAVQSARIPLWAVVAMAALAGSVWA